MILLLARILQINFLFPVLAVPKHIHRSNTLTDSPIKTPNITAS